MSKLAIRSYASDYKIYKGLQVSPIQRITDNIYSNETQYPDAYTAMKSPANTGNKTLATTSIPLSVETKETS